jgi:TolB protein
MVLSSFCPSMGQAGEKMLLGGGGIFDLESGQITEPPLERIGATKLSPDGSKIVYIPGTSDIWIVDRDGSNQMFVTHDEFVDREPSWSPDGTQIVFRRLNEPAGTGWDLFIVNVDGTDLRQLTDMPRGEEQKPVWSPDGTQIAFFALGISTAQIFLINSDGTDLRQLTDFPSGAGTPIWSPDGQQIAFIGKNSQTISEEVEFDLYIINRNGSNLRNLTNSPGFYECPCWSPNGTRLAYNFSKNVDESLNTAFLYTIHIDGTNEQLLLDDSFSCQTWFIDEIPTSLLNESWGRVKESQ